MKIYTYLLLLIFSYSYSQEIQFNGKVEYKMYLNLIKMQEYQSALLFNDLKSVFTYSQVPNNNDIEYLKSSKGIENHFIIRDTATYQIIIDKTKKLLYDKRRNIAEKEMHYSIENIPNLKWKLLLNKKHIQNIECHLAKTSFRGRTYYAWYAPSIASSFGPWKLIGLPGMIIEAYDEDKEVIFYLKSINIPYKKTAQVFNKGLSVISIEEHIKNLSKLESQVQSKIQSKMVRGIAVKVMVVTRDIELNFNDIKE